MTINIYTNIVNGGWSPWDLETGLGGSEEVLIQFASYIADQGHNVTVYHNGKHGKFKGVKYKGHEEFKSYIFSDVFIAFKNREILNKTVKAKKKYFWTTEILKNLTDRFYNNVDAVYTISDYHKSTMLKKHDKLKSQYLWFDKKELDKSFAPKKNIMLYSSSFDRGLEQLLINIDKLQKKLEFDKLVITYGWDFWDKANKGNSRAQQWKNKMLKLMDNKIVEVKGRLSRDKIHKQYWQAKYWALPLNNPESELFCINAVKAQYCEAIPVVRKIGALTETVNDHYDFQQLLGDKTRISPINTDSVINNKEHALKFEINKQIPKWWKVLKK